MYLFFEWMTLLSLPMVLHSQTKDAIRAGIKYLLYSFAGAFAGLLGIPFLMKYGTTLNFIPGGVLDPALTEGHESLLLGVAFAVILGFGAKAGIYPLHAWLPAAHSEAPALTSGLLSGALCICALYVLLRATAIVMPVVGLDFISSMYVGFGLLTIALAVPFVVVQRDVKRMLAYSSMENFGLLAAGFGLFMPLAAEASLLHMFNHALVKYMLFYTAGTIMETYATKNMMRIHGMMQQAPKTAMFWLLGIVGILGMPPMGVFFSKFYIIASFFQAHHPYLGILALVLLAGMLIGILYHAMRMLGGKPTRKAAGELMGKLDSCVLLLMLAVSGVVSAFAYELPYVGTLLTEAVKVVMGGF
jgi:hydrogenase-4 component F